MKLAHLIILGILAGAACVIGLTHRPSRVETFYGAADASAVETLGPDWFVMADDEDNRLRIFRRDLHDAPVFGIDLSAFLRIGRGNLESDLEASARLGDQIFWITSHGRNAGGKLATARHCFFATHLTSLDGAPRLEPVGRNYTNLLADLALDDRFARFDLGQAATRAPKDSGGLNIEGLAATPAGGLLIGFRNPVPQGRALLIPMLNPLDVIEGRPARFGDPLLLELGGLGIRSLTYWAGRYWILAGATGGEGEIVLYQWSGGDDPPHPWPHAELAGLRPEGLAGFQRDGQDWLWLLSDDGIAMVGNRPAKRLQNPLQKHFRALAIRLDGSGASPSFPSL